MVLGNTDPVVTISGATHISFDDVLSETMTVLNIAEGVDFKPSSCGNPYFFRLLREINVSPENQSCSSENGVLYNKEKTVLYACPPAYEGELVVSNTVTKIADEAFAYCVFLEGVTLPPSMTEIGASAFAHCKSLKKINLPESVRTIGKEAFKYCAKLTSAGVAGTGGKKGFSYEFAWTDSIPENAFSGMQKLKKVVLPDTIKVIGKNAFKKCKALEEINLPEGVKVGAKEFKDCVKLTLGGSEEKTDFVIQNGRLVKYRGGAQDIVIPDEVTCIGRKAFEKKTFTSVTIPASVKVVEQEAFYYSDIEHLIILGVIEKLGLGAFEHFGHWSEIHQLLFCKVPLKGFTESERDEPCWYFIDHFDSAEIDAEVAEQNFAYLGKHMLQMLGYSKYSSEMIGDRVAKKPELLQKLMEERQIPYQDMDALIEHFQPTGPTQLVAALLNYKAEIGQGRAPKPVKLDMSVADWRKLYKFRYVDGGVELIGCHIRDEIIAVPEMIGEKVVQSLGRMAFDGHEVCRCAYDEEPQSYGKILLPETITRISSCAFYCLHGMEVYIPNSVTELHESTFLVGDYLRIHIPNSVQSIEPELIADTLDTVKIFAAPGSYAETYAKEHNIPFEAE
jgi:hypothetical protein